jgi:hypothetical protein
MFENYDTKSACEHYCQSRAVIHITDDKLAAALHAIITDCAAKQPLKQLVTALKVWICTIQPILLTQSPTG